jgi:hypothetical protein
MPPGHRPPIPPGIARVAISGSVYGHKWVQVFYLQLTGSGVTVNDLQSLSDAIEGLYNTNIKAWWPSVVTLTDVSIVYIVSAGVELTFEKNYSLTGTSAASPIDNASGAVVVRWKISAYYRGGHPRSYMPGPTSDYVSNGSDVSGSAQTNIASAWNAVRNGINAITTTNITGVVMGTLSFQTGNAWRVTPVFRPFTSVSINPKLGTQRRRILS